jgi:hypothetical protein
MFLNRARTATKRFCSMPQKVSLPVKQLVLG